VENLQIYCDEMSAQLKEWDAKIGRLEVKARMTKGDAEPEIVDEIHFLKTKKRAVVGKLGDLRDATGDACLLIKDDMQKAMSDLEASFENAISRFK